MLDHLPCEVFSLSDSGASFVNLPVAIIRRIYGLPVVALTRTCIHDLHDVLRAL